MITYQKKKASLLGCIKSMDEIEEARSLLEGEKLQCDQAKVDLERIVLMEEITWRQKSLLLWLKLERRGKKYYVLS